MTYDFKDHDFPSDENLEQWSISQWIQFGQKNDVKRKLHFG